MRLYGSFKLQESDLVPNMVLLGFNPFIVDSTIIEHQYEIRDAGKYRISVELYSLNFPPVRQNICFTLDKIIEQFEVCKDSCEDGKQVVEKKDSKHVSEKPMASSTFSPVGGTVAVTLPPGVDSHYRGDHRVSYSPVAIADQDY